MQVYPSVTTSHFSFNNKKRPRSTADDIESNYLKKRLISNIRNLPQTTTTNTTNGMYACYMTDHNYTKLSFL